VRYALWDSNQRPLYQQCAKDFEAANPGIRIRIQQLGWDDYWTSLATGFISNTAPDVFTNHVAKFSEFVLNGVVVDLAPLIARDRVPVDIYEDGLLPMWQYQGRQYALPTDWDTVALAVNLRMLQAAGLDLAALRRLDWNPKDGGSFGRVIARLSIDEQGKRGDEPGFDPTRVKTYGFQLPGPGGMLGQTQWSGFAASAGFSYQAAPWDPALRYDHPALIDTLHWFASLPAKGVSAPPERVARLGADAMFMSGQLAIVPEGSWMVGYFRQHARFDHAWIPLPVGPIGKSTSMRNSLALSIWAGSPQREAAWQWVRYVGSRACQQKLAPAGIVYPAVKGLAEVALAAQQRQGADAAVFLEAARGSTFLPPIAPGAAEITDLMNTTIERILSGRARAADVLPAAARRAREIAAQP
jgi:multiple sugar transport system substrate-binding protein